MWSLHGIVLPQRLGPNLRSKNPKFPGGVFGPEARNLREPSQSFRILSLQRRSPGSAPQANAAAESKGLQRGFRGYRGFIVTDSSSSE